MTRRALLRAALTYVEAGWPIAPGATPYGSSGRRTTVQCAARPVPVACSCGRPECWTPAAHPRDHDWLQGVITDPADVRSWWGSDAGRDTAGPARPGRAAPGRGSVRARPAVHPRRARPRHLARRATPPSAPTLAAGCRCPDQGRRTTPPPPAHPPASRHAVNQARPVARIQPNGSLRLVGRPCAPPSATTARTSLRATGLSTVAPGGGRQWRTTSRAVVDARPASQMAPSSSAVPNPARAAARDHLIRQQAERDQHHQRIGAAHIDRTLSLAALNRELASAQRKIHKLGRRPAGTATTCCSPPRTCPAGGTGTRSVRPTATT